MTINTGIPSGEQQLRLENNTARSFLKCNEPGRHQIKTTIQHWQLRDLVICPQDQSDILLVNQNNVLSYNPKSKKIEFSMKDLNFSPSSIAYGCGFIAVGGQRSQLAIRNIYNNWFVQTSLGGSINNSLYIVDSQGWGGDPRLFVCNNDETLKIFSLPNLTRLTTLKLPTAVNHATTSKDGKFLVAVGDCNSVWLFNNRSSSNSSSTYSKQATLSTTNDAGFSTAWSESSDKFAVATQDGYICVWDVRFLSTKLACIRSQQFNQGTKGACRNVKFSQNGAADLLLFTEHASYVSLVDCRDFESKQTIRVCPPSGDVHISGACFSSDCSSIWVGLENQLLNYEIDSFKRRGFPFGNLH